MPKTYYAKPAPWEGLRCLLVRGALLSLLSALALVTKVLPQGHPVGIFVRGRVPEMRELLKGATVPASHPVAAAIAKHRRLWIAGLLVLAAALIGDLSSAIALDPFGLPDIDVSIVSAIPWIGVDGMNGDPHILSYALPWHRGDPQGLGLLTACICAVYSMCPCRAPAFD